MKSKIIYLVISSFVITACGTTSITRLSSKTYEAKSEDCNIQILSSKPLNKKFEELAIVTSSSGQSIFDGKNLDSMLPSMKEEACKLGADALIIKAVEEGGTAWLMPTKGNATAVAIKYASLE